MRAILAVLLLVFFGAACVLAGAYLLSGLAYALILCGVMLFGAAAIVRSGMTVDG